MLDKQALSQLSQLKSDIVASKDYATGKVVGTNGRFGFVKTEDGRDAYLSPEKMEKLLPGDQVKVSLVKNKKDKLEATIEELLSSPTDRFIGTYRTKGKAHFVAPDIEGFNRWIFIPPQARAKCKEGDLVVSRLVRHPIKDGKAQAKVLERIGRPDDDKIEFKHTRAKFDLNHENDQKELDQIQKIEARYSAFDFADKTDMTDIPLVTIDSATTRDMDDAIAIEKSETGYTLTVAIADPTSFIEQGSPLAKSSQDSGQTIYMLGGAIPMLPPALSNHCLSLEEDKPKLALVCKMNISLEGEITRSELSYGIVKSHHKLTYDDVSAFLDQDEDTIPETVKAPLQTLAEFAALRLEYRKAHNIVGPEQSDYEYNLSQAGKIETIKAKPKNTAHRLVEESMVATNMCAAELLAEHNVGLAHVNEGFRKERLGEVKALLKEEGVTTEGDIETLEGFKELLEKLESDKEKAYLLQPLRRMMQFGQPSLAQGPHLGMGVAHYATITSPIRRFADLYNHWALKHILTDAPFKALSDKHLEALNANLTTAKQAERELFQWLMIQYVETLIGTEAFGRIRIVTQQGFGVKIDENGIEGFILFPKKIEKKYDAKRMTMQVGEDVYKLDQTVKVKIASVDKTKRRIAFELVN